MEQFDWTRVGVVSDNSIEHSYSALVNVLGGNVVFYPFQEAAADTVFGIQSFIWPQLKHTWIVYEHQVEDFFYAMNTCDNDTMRSALEGVFLIQYQLSTNDCFKANIQGALL